MPTLLLISRPIWLSTASSSSSSSTSSPYSSSPSLSVSAMRSPLARVFFACGNSRWRRSSILSIPTPRYNVLVCLFVCPSLYLSLCLYSPCLFPFVYFHFVSIRFPFSLRNRIPSLPPSKTSNFPSSPPAIRWTAK